jgi:hypothetical protein
VEDRIHRGQVRAALPNKTSLPQADNLVLEVHNLNRLVHRRPPKDRAPSKGTLQEALAVVRGHRQVPRAEDRVLRGRGRVVLPNKTSPPQVDNLVLELRNLRPLALQKLGKGRVLRKKPPQEVLAVVPRGGHRQALDNKINSHKALLVQGARRVPPSPWGQKRKGQPKGVVARENHPRRKS